MRDAINSMPVSDAIDLVNWIPQQYGVRSRKGFSEWAIGFGAPIRTVFQYAPDRDNVLGQQLFAATDSDIYDITTSTAAPISVETLTGADQYGRLTTSMMANSAGTFLLITSNEGGYRYYDGTTWTTPIMGGGAGQVAGVDPADLIYIQMWKRRAWFIEKGTANVWYGPVDSLTGTFNKLDVGPQLVNGGVLSFIGRWTIDAGEGIDDFLVIGGENGDIVIYKGTDPASSSTFGLVGVWYVGRLPVGHRCSIQYGGDLLIITATGIQPLSYVTRGGQSLLRSSSVDYLSKVQPRFGELLSSLSDQLGWELTLSLQENLLIVQVPTNGTSVFDQYVMYTNGNTWCKFTGMPMACAFAGQMGFFFGTEDGRVCKGLSGYFDDVAYGETVGNGIGGIIQPAYSYFGRPGMNKQWQMVRPTFLAADRPGVTVAVVADYQQNILSGSPVYTIGDGALWDVALWDLGVWSGNLRTYDDWYAAAAIGYAGTAYFVTVVVGDTFLVSIDYMFEPGGII